MDTLTTEFAFEALVSIDAATKMGDTALGKRRFIGITGGTFQGPRIEGEVIAGGADWQTVRADGVTVIEAIYALKTTDGARIRREAQAAARATAITRLLHAIKRFEDSVKFGRRDTGAVVANRKYGRRGAHLQIDFDLGLLIRKTHCIAQNVFNGAA